MQYLVPFLELHSKTGMYQHCFWVSVEPLIKSTPLIGHHFIPVPLKRYCQDVIVQYLGVC